MPICAGRCGCVFRRTKPPGIDGFATEALVLAQPAVGPSVPQAAASVNARLPVDSSSMVVQIPGGLRVFMRRTEPPPKPFFWTTQAIFKRRRSSHPSDPATKERAAPSPAGSISGTGVMLLL